jgi:hypothetical protein
LVSGWFQVGFRLNAGWFPVRFQVGLQDGFKFVSGLVSGCLNSNVQPSKYTHKNLALFDYDIYSKK